MAASEIFAARSGVPLASAAGYTVHFGEIRDGTETVDQVVATVFRAPHSYTGEDSVEISCHGSTYIRNRIIQLLLSAGGRAGGESETAESAVTIGAAGAAGEEEATGEAEATVTAGAAEKPFRVRMAEPGEFTARAFLAGKLDLSQAEAVADLIASSNRAQHRVAMAQMRGGVSSALASLRGELVALAALLELELDFSEEDVEFASRERLSELAGGIGTELDRLISSFSLGNAIRQGVPVAIVGRPNAGKSTLLNTLAGDDRAMVSEIAGTTRDRIEERVNIGGVGFRFIDTAGLRETEDVLERMGIDRTLEAVSKACIVLLVVDASGGDTGGPGCREHAGEAGDSRASAFARQVRAQIAELDLSGWQRLCVVLNKADKTGETPADYAARVADAVGTVDAVGACEAGDKGCKGGSVDTGSVAIGSKGVEGTGTGTGLTDAGPGNTFIALSAKTGANLDALTEWLAGTIDTGALEAGSAVVSGARHHEALMRAREATQRVSEGLRGSVPADLLAEDIREVSYHLGTITGEVTTDEILGAIFSKFCIGK